MGIGSSAIKLYADLAAAGLLHIGQSVCELGSQDYVPVDCDPHILDIALGVAPPADVSSSRSWMEGLGFRYTCIDADGRHGALPLDLNEATAADVPGAPFDVVTNHGTTEHIIDQANCFRLMHDLTAVGGLMVHIVPASCPGYVDHGFFLYSPCLFADLASANGYEILRSYPLHDEARRAEAVVAVIRRTSDRPFVKPVQAMYRR